MADIQVEVEPSISRPSTAPGTRVGLDTGWNTLRKSPSTAMLPVNPSVSDNSFDTSPSPADTEPSNPKPGILKSAFDSTRHFASSLISAPHESSGNYTIMRHSLGLIYYRGPGTTVSITILASKPLAQTRKLFLQRRGLSGNLGMNLATAMGALPLTNWIDVTPATVASAKDVSEQTERGWQRDMERFRRKATRPVRSHVPRETHIIRIPAAAQDGYFRLVLCKGDRNGGTGKVLCCGPVFRLASTSRDASVLRGASFLTLPIEIGVKVASVYANNTVGRVVAPVTAAAGAAGTAVQNAAGEVAKNVVPNEKARKIAAMVYYAAGVEDKAEEYEDRYHTIRDARYDPLHDWEGHAVIGADQGPEAPYPIKFEGAVAKGSGNAMAQMGILTASLSDVRDDVKMRMKGVFFGWGSVLTKKGLTGVGHDWHVVIVNIGPAANSTPSVVAKPSVTVCFTHSLDDASIVDAKVKVVVMGFLHKQLTRQELADSDLVLSMTAKDMDISTASLSREGWGPEEALNIIKRKKAERGLGDRYTDVRTTVQTSFDKVPLHAAGIRTAGAAMRDHIHGNGGIWIPR